MVVESTLVNKARRGEIGSRRSLEAGEGGDSEVRNLLWSAGAWLSERGNDDGRLYGVRVGWAYNFPVG